MSPQRGTRNTEHFLVHIALYSPRQHLLYYCPMDTLSLNELAELLLAALYEEMQNLKHTNYFLSVDDVAASLGVEDREGIVEACHLLEEKSYVLLTYDHLTSLSAFITPIGENFVREGGETGIIAEYQRYRAAAGADASNPDGTGAGFQPPLASSFQPPPSSTPPPPTPAASEQPGTMLSGEAASHIIASMELIVRNDPSLSESAKNDLVIDLRTLELQMSRGSIGRSVVDAVTAELRGVPALIPLIDFLLTMKGVG